MGGSSAQTAVLSARRTLPLPTALMCLRVVAPAVRNSSVCYQLALVRLSVRCATAAGRDERAIFG